MLIPLADIQAALDAHRVSVHGVFHVGAHECEEMAVYDQMGLPRESVVWVDAMEHKVAQARAWGGDHHIPRRDERRRRRGDGL
jgi:hypothetical protein